MADLPHYYITTTPDDPKRGIYGIEQASNQLEALDRYAVRQGYAPYSSASADEFQEAVGIDKHGLWAVCGNATIWAIPHRDLGEMPLAQLRFDGVTVSITRNSETAQLIVQVNTEEIGARDTDEDGSPFLELTLNDFTYYDNEPRQQAEV